ncbi:MAG: Nicotinamide-nucleotide amidohydrolase PncC [Chlamydiae bacterium]|nr:Nicotinamide-nucleotide amidohydrolase PncC [Chlamydiota bacterium]
MNTKIEVITIGNELLEGRITNTNVQYVCKKLYAAGYLTHRQSSVLDNKKALTSQIETSLKHSDIVICSGGLGPTQDDITLAIAANIFKSDFHLNEVLLKNLKKQYGKRLDPTFILPFARVPKKATLMLDHVGMAPGFMFKKGKKRLILLPGVPYEFEHLVDKELIPYLKRNYPQKSKEYKKIIHFCRVAESHMAPFIDTLLKKYSQLSVGIYPHLGTLSVHFKVSTTSLKEANAILNPCIGSIKKEFSHLWFDGKYKSIEEAVAHFLKKENCTLSLAESCTGGALSACLTAMPGTSDFLKGSVVAYHNDVKSKLLQVKETTLKKEGAVSEECVKQMVMGAQKLFKTDFSIATSGIAGPSGGSLKKPVGYVWIAIAYKNKILISQNLQLSGERSTIIERTVNYVLAEFWINKDNI